MTLEKDTLVRENEELVAKAKESTRPARATQTRSSRGRTKRLTGCEKLTTTWTRVIKSTETASSSSHSLARYIAKFQRLGYMSEQDIEIEGNLAPDLLLWELSNVVSGQDLHNNFERFKNRTSWREDDNYYCLQQILRDDLVQPMMKDEACTEHLAEQAPCIQICRHMTRDGRLRLFCQQISTE